MAMMGNLGGRVARFAIVVLWIAVSASGLRADEGGTLPLAIRGYDPVAYFAEARASRGLPDFEYAWDGHRYRFMSRKHRELFKADPLRYAPQFEGTCAMALVNGYKDEADPENWLIRDGKLYVFGGPKGPSRFGAGLSENIKKANETWLKLAK
jgi:YHS domain-containing protein